MKMQIFENGKIVDIDLVDKRVSGGVYVDNFNNKIFGINLVSNQNVTIQIFGADSEIHFGEKLYIEKLRIKMGNRGLVKIGDESSFMDTVIICAYGKVNIGSDCMFSLNIFVRNHDAHHIFDMETGNRLNRNKDISIGNHVWVGQNCILMKGCILGHGAIVGAGSICCRGRYPENAIIAGNPAHVIKEGIIWKRDLTMVKNMDNLYDTE